MENFVGAVIGRGLVAASGAWVMGVYHVPPGGYWERLLIVFVAIVVLRSTILP